jgi:two-component system, chemotaxis family, protein-glutamate methylesterase/glutaminase
MIDAIPKAVVIGASAGAVEALLTILPDIPEDFSIPVFIVVHVPPDRRNFLAPLLEARCEITVKEAEDKETIVGGIVYVAPSDYHMLVEEEFSISLSSDELVNFSRPAIDVLFESAADAYGAGLMGIILSGANQDGAAGLAAVAKAGGSPIVEDPETAYAAQMPGFALAACPTAKVTPLKQVAAGILAWGAA